MSFQQGLSGLNVTQRSLDAVSNNVANAGTVGFKLSQAQFADVFAASLSGGGASQIGIGSTINQVAQQFTQGNITVTNNPLDVAVNGAGFFRMNTNGSTTYTRNGQFLIDRQGFVVNAQGAQLTGYGVTPDGTIVPGQPVPLQIETADISPRSTEASRVGFNLDSRSQSPTAMTTGLLSGSAVLGVPTTNILAGQNDLTLTLNNIATVSVTIPPGGYSQPQLASTIQTLLNAQLPANQAVTVTTNANAINISSIGARGSDSLLQVSGGAVPTVLGATSFTAGIDNFNAANPNSYTSSTSQTVYDSKGNPHTFTMYFAKTAQAGQWDLYTSLDGSLPTAPTPILFNSSGQLLSAMPLSQSFALSNGASSPLGFTVDLTGSTEFGNVFGVNQMIQDGFSSGRLSGLSIAADGVVQGRYSNGQARNLGQIVLVNFNNPNGMLSLGGNQWAETADSGQPLVGTPGTGSLGMVQAAAVEESNVDLTTELVNMITQQRAYQANAQSIRTQDQLLQTLVNLR